MIFSSLIQQVIFFRILSPCYAGTEGGIVLPGSHGALRVVLYCRGHTVH